MVYVERINVPASRTSGDHLRMFAKLTRAGPRSAKHVILTTTMWDLLGSKIDDGNKREERLKKYWEDMNHPDANVKRFLNDSDSAWSIVDSVVENRDQKKVLSTKMKAILRSLVLLVLRDLLPKPYTDRFPKE